MAIRKNEMKHSGSKAFRPAKRHAEVARALKYYPAVLVFPRWDVETESVA